MKVVPLELKDLNALVQRWHRHHKPVQGHRYSIGVTVQDRLVGGCSVGRPVARLTDLKTTVEITRLVTDGFPNACSFLYGAAAKVAKALGYQRIQTFTLASESGTSLKAAGWRLDGLSSGGQWEHSTEKQLRLDGGTRRRDQPTEPKQRWVKDL